MTTSRKDLSPLTAELPTSNPPGRSIDGQGRPYLAFDATTSENCAWTFRMWQGFTGPLTAIVTFRAASATTGNFQPDLLLEAITPGDATDTDSASSFDSANTPTAVNVPGTAGHITTVTVTITNNDSVAAGDLCRVRHARNTADTAAGDIQVLNIELQDAA